MTAHIYRRQHKRYALKRRIEIASTTSVIGFGYLVDISAGGASLECLCSLQVGSDAEFSIDEIGTYRGKIVRQSNGKFYGISFYLDDSAQRRLARRLNDLFNVSEAKILMPS